MTTAILLADDHCIMREGLRSMLEAQPGFQVVAEADNGRMAVQLASERRPDVVIMDISMPDLNGIEATRQILAATPLVHVIALSIHSDRRFVLQMFKAGAAGYLLKNCAFEELTRAIRIVIEGQTYVSPAIAGIMVTEANRGSAPEVPSVRALSRREREVLQLMAEGRTTKEVAARLRVSAKTVESHRKHLMEKLNLNSVAELTKYAIREGLTSL